MQKAFEKIIERLEEVNPVDYGRISSYEAHSAAKDCLRDAIEIINQVASEYGKKSAKEDLISKRALIEVLNKFVGQIFACDGIDTDSVIEYQRVHKDYTAYIMQGFEYVYELLPDVPTVQIGDGWIPVSERLPSKEEYLKNDGRFIVTDGNRVYEGIFNIYDLRFQQEYSGFEDTCVIAWQPLPAPYKESEE